MYDILVLAHILSAMVWVGGGFVVVAVQRHAHKVGGREGFARTISELEWMDDWIFTPAPLLVIITGITMVSISEAWAFSQPWIYLALGLILVEGATGSRDLKRLKGAERRAPTVRSTRRRSRDICASPPSPWECLR